MVVVQYRQSDGRICGGFQSDNLATLTAQTQAADATYGYLLLEATEPIALLQERYRIQEALLVEKACITLQAHPASFAADGVTESTITVEPFVPCTLLVNRSPVVLTEEDQTLVLTAAAPQQFTIALQPQGQAWATPIVVEAI